MKNKKLLIILSAIFIFIIVGISSNDIYAYSVNVDNFASFKDYMEKSEEVTINLTGVIQATGTVYVRGNKTIYGNEWYINNYLNAVSGGSNEVLSLQSGSNLTLRGCYFNGQNKTTIASTNITVGNGAVCNVYNSEIYNGTQGIHVSTNGTLNFYSGKLAGNEMCGVGSYGTVNFSGGTVSDGSQGLHNNGGTLNLSGGSITAKTYGVYNHNNGNVRFSGGNVYGATHGIYNAGTVNMTNGKIYQCTNGIYNTSGKTATISGGEIYSSTNGINNLGTINLKGGTIHTNSIGITNTGTLNVSAGTIKNNTAENGSAIFQNGTCTITGGTFAEDQNVYLASNNRFVSTNSSYPTFVIKPNTYSRGRLLVKTSGDSYAIEELNHLTLVPQDRWEIRDSGANIVIWDKSNLNIKYLDEEGNELADSETKTDWVGEEYVTSSKSIKDYRVKISPENSSGTYGETDTEVTYIYEPDTGKIEVRYIDAISGQILEKIEEAGLIGTEFISEPKTIEGYTLTKEPENKTINFAKDTTILTYEYKKISQGVETRYIDQVTLEEISDRDIQEGLENVNYITTAKTIPGYTLVVTPDNSIGEMSVEKTIVTFEYRKLVNVIIKFIDLNSNTEILDPVTKTYKQGDTYTTEAINIQGYELVSTPDNTSEEIGASNVIVTYGYKKTTGGVDIRYVDQVSGSEIYSTIHFDGVEGTSYTSEAKDISGYELVKTPERASGQMSVDKITIEYEYRKLSNVVVKYMDLINNIEISELTSVTYKEGDTYTTQAKQIDKYELVNTPQNSSGTLGNTNITVIYGYKRISNGVDVRYINQVTGEEISLTEHIDGLEDDNYSVTSKDIPGYELVLTPANISGEMTADKITVTFEYRKLSNVIIRYIDANSNEEIENETVNSYKEGDKYTTLPINIEGYVITMEPDNKDGVVETEDIIVIYNYKKVSEGLVVKYVDTIKNEVLDSIEYTGNEGDKITLEKKELEGYTLVDSPNTEEITLTPELQEILFYYKKNVKTEVIGVDANSNEELYKDEVSGLEGDEYTSSAKELEGYSLVEKPENETITMDRDTIKIIYKYKKISGGLVIRYVDDYSGDTIEEEKINGLEGDNYLIEPKEFEKYDFKEVEGSSIGQLTVEPIEVVFHYEKKTGIVEIIYIDENGNELLSDTLEDKVDNKYSIDPKEIQNYRIKEYPTNSQGIYKVNKQIVTYVMEKIPGKVIIQIKDDDGNIIETIEEEGKVGEEYEIELPEKQGYTYNDEKIIKGQYEEGDKIIEVIYHLDKASPDTGDINVGLTILLIILFVAGIIYVVKKYKKK